MSSFAAFRTRATQASQSTTANAEAAQQQPEYITYDLPRDAFAAFDALDAFAGLPATPDAFAGLPATPDAFAGLPATPDAFAGLPATLDAFDALAGFPATLDPAQHARPMQLAPSLFDISMYTPEPDATLLAWPTGAMDIDMDLEFVPYQPLSGVGHDSALGLCTPPLSPASLYDSPYSTPASSPFHRALDVSMAVEIGVGMSTRFTDVTVYEPGTGALFAHPEAVLATSDTLAVELSALALEDKPRADSGARMIAFADTVGAC